MRTLVIALTLALLTAASGQDPPVGQSPVTGPWRARLVSPGGEIPFGLELEHDGEAWRATLVNGRERIAVPEVQADDSIGAFVLKLPHYDSQVLAAVVSGGSEMEGMWAKRRGPEEWVTLPFHANAGAGPRFSADVLLAPPADADPAALARELAQAASAVDGRWAVRFESSADPAVGVFTVAPDGAASGTFLTTTGDYRFLAGSLDRAWAGDDGLVGCVDDGRAHFVLRLSCFDGAHAFKFEAQVQPDGSLSGGFWSGATWHEAWTAVRDADTALPDGFALSRASGAVTLDDLVFPDLDGVPRRLSDPAFAGKARILQVFGSWCPNCHDASDELVRLQREYGPRGLSIVGLAFELTGDPARDGAQVRRYAERHGVTWPLLLAGLADKAKATASLGLLDRVQAFPTTIFLDAAGGVRAVHTGFNGPATGAAYEQQHAEFVRVIEGLLGGD
jgi:thiol-disulfide isomerase/thioredoxin